jgi:hypothetical protein
MHTDLLVPGTSGCKLLLDGVDIGWPTELTATAWLAGLTSLWAGFPQDLISADPERLVKLLSMEFGDTASSAPTRTTLAGGTMTCGSVLRLAYNQFTDFKTFVYDWRSDIRESAAKLVERLETRSDADRRWRILAHSQGGLVVVAASKLYARKHGDDDRAFSRIVSHVVLLATPLLGTVNAAEALIVGDNLAPSFREHFRRIVRTWPALHQMLPTWPGSVQLGPGDAAAPYNLMDDRAWVGLNIDAALLKRARETRQEFLRAPLSRMNGVEVQIMMSRALPTRDRVIQTSGGLALADPTSTGDGLVPEPVTHARSGKVERDRMQSFGGGTGTTLQHFVLANDPVIATATKDFFRS